MSNRTQPEDRSTLLDIAMKSIAHGVEHGSAWPVHPQEYTQALQEHRAAFVTLYRNDRLRGCIGSLEGWRPLVRDVSENAYSAAFRDGRFSPVKDWELSSLKIKLSLLTTPQPMQFVSEEDLLRQIRPGIDGLVLRYGSNRGTFLPSVWENLPNKRDFWSHLKRKASLPVSWWSNQAQVSRYQSEHIE